jgi:PAS domain S-box-containing protein
MARHRFFTLSPEVLCAIGYDGYFQRGNPAFSDTFGYEGRELRSISFVDLVDETDRPLAKQELTRLIEDGEKREFEIRCRCANGSEKWLAWTAKPYPEDKVIYAAARETTQAKIAQQKLKQYNRELQQLSEAAQAATVAKSELLANVSHELRTPMSAILMISDILEENVDGVENRESVSIIKRNGQYLLTLINQLLDLSKIEAGKLSVEFVQCSPLHVLAEVESLARLRAEAKSLALDITPVRSIPGLVRTDPTRLREILTNLVDNAIKFTEVGGVTVSVQFVRSPRPQLRFEVADTGMGMSEEQMDRLFQPFVQADSSTTRQFGGTGLGLTISRRLAKMLGGDISVTSKLHQGSTFTLIIDAEPISGGNGQHDQQRREKTPNECSSGISPLNCRVLLAEDYPDIQRPVTYVLNSVGAQVTVAENGRQAVDMAVEAEQRDEPFDVVLMDMQMPDVDGYAATRELRQHGYERPIIAITAHALESDRRKCLTVGCDDYVAKPLDMAKLVDLIRHYCRRLVST